MFQLQQENGLELIKNYVSNTNTSKIYGFILYTESDPYVIKVLRDNDFWTALDRISGANWPIFSVRPLVKGFYNNNSSSNTGMISFMVQTWVEPQSNEVIIRNFGLSSSNDLPCFVAFIWDDNDELQSISVPIKGNNIDNCYNSIREIVDVITKAEKNVRQEYKRNVEVFNIVADELKALQTRNTLKSLGKITKKFVDFFSVFK